MQRTSFVDAPCPIARSLERVGEWWSVLILRDAFGGLTRFDEFQKNLGIAPNMLTRRLAALVEAGLLERRRYSERPPRDEYVLTERGRDFRPVLVELATFGKRHFASPTMRSHPRYAALATPAAPAVAAAPATPGGSAPPRRKRAAAASSRETGAAAVPSRVKRVADAPSRGSR